MDENVRKILKKVYIIDNPFKKPSSQIFQDKLMNPVLKSKLKESK